MYISLLFVQGGSAGSESGGSGVDSITGEHNVSGRSSAYGDNVQEPLVGARSETSSLGAPAGFQVCVYIIELLQREFIITVWNKILVGNMHPSRGVPSILPGSSPVTGLAVELQHYNVPVKINFHFFSPGY